MTEKRSLNTGHENYGNKFKYHELKNFILIQDNNIEILKSILSKCSYLEVLELNVELK